MSVVRLSFLSEIRSDERTVSLPQGDTIWIPDCGCVFPGAATKQTGGERTLVGMMPESHS